MEACKSDTPRCTCDNEAYTTRGLNERISMRLAHLLEIVNP